MSHCWTFGKETCCLFAVFLGVQHESAVATNICHLSVVSDFVEKGGKHPGCNFFFFFFFLSVDGICDSALFV